METREEVTTVLLGRNTVKEALKSGREIDAIYLTEAAEANAKDIVALAKRAGVPIKRASKAKLDEMSQFAAQGQKASNHQGILAKAAAVRYRTLEDAQVLAEQRGEPLFLIALDGIEDPHNLGAIIRTANLAGAHGVIIPKHRAVGLTATVAKASAGAVEYMKVARVTNINTAIAELKDKGVWVFGTAAEGSIPMYKADLTIPAAIVIGNEGEGLSQLVRKNCDVMVSIPMKGKISSLNASAAASILLYEAVRQRIG